MGERSHRLASTGAKIATSEKKIRIPSPTIPIVLLRYWRHMRRAESLRRRRAIARGLLIGAAASLGSPSGGGPGSAGMPMSIVGFMSPRPHARIEVGVEQVGHEVRDDHRRAEQQEQALEQGEVLVPDGQIRQATQPGPREDR